MSRKRNSIINLITSVVPYFIITLLGFARVNAYIYGLGKDIYALNQVYLQIFSYISIAEAGAGTLVTQLYYKALANKDEHEVNVIFTSCKYLFRKISVIILGIGIIVSFFLNLFTNNDLPLIYMQITFILFLIRSVLEYLMLSPRFVIQADQKIYKVNLLIQGYRILEIIAEIALLRMGVDFITLLIVTIIIRVISYVVTNRKVYKEYPWLKSLDKNEVVRIKGMNSVFYHKVVGAVYYNTDILLLSSFLNSTIVTIYSSYNYIVKALNDIVQMIAMAATPSFGNVMVVEEREKAIDIFEEINSVFIFIGSVLFVVLYGIMTPFVMRWIGVTMIMDNFTMILMIATLYLTIILRPFHMIKEVKNLFRETQYIVLIEAVINLILSVLLIGKLGMKGVLLATIIAKVCTTFIYLPVFMYNKVLRKSSIDYYVKISINILIIIPLMVFTNKYITISHNGYIQWFTQGAIYGIVVTLIIFVITYIYSKDFRRVIGKFTKNLRRKKES